MAFSCVSMATLSPPPSVRKEHSIAGGIAHADKALQVKGHSIQQLPQVVISRRDAVACLTASVASTFFPIEPVEARIVKPEIRRKIKEKLDKIREKAGIKPKEDSKSGEGKEQPNPATPFNTLTVPIVEATI